MYGKVKDDVQEILKILCGYKKVKIVEGAVCKDHVHLALSPLPPSKRGAFGGCGLIPHKAPFPEGGRSTERANWGEFVA